MDIHQFQRLESKSKAFKYTSFVYVSYEDIKDYEIITYSDEIILIKGFNNQTHLDEIIYMCQDLEVLIIHLKDYPNTLIKHIPMDAYQKFVNKGFIEYAILRDYWLNDLSNFNVLYDQVFIAKEEHANIISQITKDNRGVSRSFYGEDEAFIRSWINGFNPQLIEMQSTQHKIYVFQENDEILGVLLTAIYGHQHPKGPTMWVREIAVKRAYHHQGIGKKLMISALSIAKRDGAKRSFLMADDLNQHAIKLYKHLGYVPNMDEQEINLLTPQKEHKA